MKLLELFARSPLWAILPEAAMIAPEESTDTVITFVSRGLSYNPESGRYEAGKPSMLNRPGGKISVVPIEGVLTKDGPAWYGSNYDGISRAVESAAADPEVKHIVLAVDSPGGEVTGLPETAAVIANAAKTKPVSAMVTGMAASAAYWLTSQARDITLTPSGEVGSVGVRMMHMDISKMMDNAGIGVTELHSGEFKTEWSPFRPLTEAAKEDMQSRLNATHAEFLKSVQAGRAGRATQDITSQRFGEGRMFSADTAKAHGLVDNVQSAREFYRAILPAAEESTPAFPMRRTEKRLQVMRARIALERAKR